MNRSSMRPRPMVFYGVERALDAQAFRRLLDEVRRRLGSGVALILSSVPDAVGFYERAGMERIADAFWYQRRR